jgi:hypothetical protein
VYGDRKAVRIEQQLLAIESTTAPGFERSVCAGGVNLPGFEARYEDVPIVIRAIAVGIESDDGRRC